MKVETESRGGTDTVADGCADGFAALNSSSKYFITLRLTSEAYTLDFFFVVTGVDLLRGERITITSLSSVELSGGGDGDLGELDL